MEAIRSRWSSLLGGLAAAGLVACGGILGGGGGGPTSDMRGNIEATTPDVGERDIVVFVYSVKQKPADCTEPELPDQDEQEQSRIIQPGDTEFEVRNAKSGPLVVVFLLDNEGRRADGRIDPGDPIAILDDPDCVLDDVPNRYIVEADDLRLNFSDAPADGFPDPGRASAGSLTEAPE